MYLAASSALTARNCRRDIPHALQDRFDRYPTPSCPLGCIYAADTS
jgi:hypothetical protein